MSENRCRLTKEQQREKYERAKELYPVCKTWQRVAERLHLHKDHLYTIRNRFKREETC